MSIMYNTKQCIYFYFGEKVNFSNPNLNITKCSFRKVSIPTSFTCLFSTINQVQLVFPTALFMLGISGRDLPWSQPFKTIQSEQQQEHWAPLGAWGCHGIPNQENKQSVWFLGTCKLPPPKFTSTGG